MMEFHRGTGRNQPRIRRASTAWVQPSLSRDFTLLAAAIAFIMLLSSAWVTWKTYKQHSENTIGDLQTETIRIERILDYQISGTNYLLSAVGKQLAAAESRKPEDVARLLQAYAAGNPKYALWSWTDASMHMLASSNKGVLSTPVDLHDRDFIQQAQQEPWIPHIGHAIEGRVSDRWVIPVGLGIADDTGKFLGTVSVSLDIGAITDQIRTLIWRDGISFAIFSKDLRPLTAVENTPENTVGNLPAGSLKGVNLAQHAQGVLSRAGLFSGLLSTQGTYTYYLASERYPYIIIVGYDGEASQTAIYELLWPRLAQIAVVFSFLLALMWLIRTRVISPAVELGVIAGQVAAGHPFRPLSTGGPLELEYLADQVRRTADYIAERQRIAEELHAKLATLQQRDELLQAEMRQRAALLAGMLREYKQALHIINTASHALRDSSHKTPPDAQYRAYAADIHQAGTSLELMVRKLIALARIDAAAVLPHEQPVALAGLVDKAAAAAAEGLAAGTLTVRKDASLASLDIRVDAVYACQALAYGLLYLVGKIGNTKEPLAASYRCVPAARGEEICVVLIGRGDTATITDDRILAALTSAALEAAPLPAEDAALDTLHFSLAHSMLRLQHMALAEIVEETGIWLAVEIPRQRVIPAPEEDLPPEDA